MPLSSVSNTSKSLRIAIVHDWLVTYAGAERVLEQMLVCYPEADLFSMVDFLPQAARGFLQGKPSKPSFIQNLPGAKKHYRQYLPLMPLAVEQLDLSGYDVIISSSHAVAKGILVSPDQLHICLCYSPIRYAWDLQHQYLKESGLDVGIKGWLARYILHRIRIWDLRTVNGVDVFIAISQFIARRIKRVYARESTVIYPPVDVDAFTVGNSKEDFYLTASRMVPYKKIDLIVKSFAAMPDRRLVVIGDGPDFEKIKAVAGSNVALLGYQSFDVLKTHLQKAKAFIFAAEEDFGIAPLEAQACGTPVIAYGKGGALETIVGLDGATPTGVFFKAQTVQSIVEAVQALDTNLSRFDATQIRANAERFSVTVFRERFSGFVQRTISAWEAAK